MNEDKGKIVEELIGFIKESPSCFQAVEQVKQQLIKAGFMELSEDNFKDECKLEHGNKYFVIRNDSSLIAFVIPQNSPEAFHIVASHSDAPSFKLKENPEIAVDEFYCKLNVEKYGGMLLSTWLDRPLSIAGRVVIKENSKLVTKLIDLKKDCCVIPNVAIHFNPDINKGYEYNPQVDMLPLFSGNCKANVLEEISNQLCINKEEILGSDLFLYNRECGRRIGINGEFLLAPRLDDLQCAFATLKGFLQSLPRKSIAVYCLFDNEEVGSRTRQGADSDFMQNLLVWISKNLGLKNAYDVLIRNSFLLSADNAHALHPNHPEKSDITNKPFLNHGVVLKFNGNARYTTDAYSAAVVRDICKEGNISLQNYANRSDITGGSTLGNISISHVSIPSADIGFAQLAMHSAMETAGCDDIPDMVNLIKIFQSK